MKLIKSLWTGFNKTLNYLMPVGDLFVRFWIARLFFLSGLSKIQSWSTTISLFQNEYQVPLLHPVIAAHICTIVELVVPIFLFLGLGQRLPAFILFVFNIIIVCSYPVLWMNVTGPALAQHFYWGILIMMIMLHGNGKLSLDYLIEYLCSRKKINL
ncbi:MAG: DoxX family protein [Proteobacteria bacterium]|nr:DoxX family protein [Pseudomonadota bacterium]